MEKNNLRLNITEEDGRWAAEIPDLEKKAQEIMFAAFDYVDANDSLEMIDFSKPVNINISLSNDNSVQELNSRYRGLDKPTNVLSFAHMDDEAFLDDCAAFDEIDLGDIIIAYETLQKEAKEKNIPLYNHFAHLLTHGILHI